ncbi:gliding motility-associated C-terminal domain-containing protein [Limibacter armeniacum]|uniref:T9SS type B sorting domain-containing protein n=1 Tax=Limibacter armeniacum TaxID=466084 RepID=UPI002FE6C282
MVTIILYRDVTGVPAGEGLVDFGDGTDPRLVSPQSLGNTEDGLTEILLYEVEHTFPSAGTYKVSYFEKNRNPTVRNMDVPSETAFYIESEFLINPILGLNSSPTLLIPPVLQARIGQKYMINAGAFDAQGDSLAYRLTICRQGRDLPVQNYRFPDDPNETWTFEREDCTRPGEFFIDPITGDLTWDAPNEAGEYNVAFFVDEFRDGQKIGSVNRDMQIIVKDVANFGPTLTVPNDTCVIAGDQITGLIVSEELMEAPCATGGLEPENHLVDLFLVTQPSLTPPSVSPSFAVAGLQPPLGREEGTLTWQTNCLDIRSEPYQFTFQTLDNPRPENDRLNAQLQLGDTKSWRIKVVGPPPQNLQAEADELNGNITLTWDNYSCGRAENIMIYRKVGSFDFQPVCETGLPAYTGYEKIAEVEAGRTSYVDNSLERGSNYCYRIFVTFEDPQGGESLASEEACAFLPATLYMTKVSVVETDTENGTIDVEWTQPTMSDLPQPISYRLFRAEGFEGKDNFVEINQTFSETQTSYTDTGLNTRDLVYHYWVELIAGGSTFDTTRTASTVRLESASQLSSIQLNWRAIVPWSITSNRFPTHLIYRKLDEEPDEAFVLIDSIIVNQAGLTYTDIGNTLSGGFVEGQVYCYRVLTYGTYEFDELPEPLLNFSQTRCTTLLDTIPPCPPILSLMSPDCSTLKNVGDYNPDDPCTDRFSNILTWVNDTSDGCDNDIVSYNIYYSPRLAENLAEFDSLIGNVPDLTFVHSNLVSLAGSYAVTALDDAGNESPISNIVTQDNECPIYELPNAFSPNGDGINDLFIPMRCPRFVRSVEFEVFNRWGESIYEFNSESDDGSDVEIMWNGENKNGKIISSGTYFYQADVQFYRLNEADEKVTIKGWIQVIRNKDDTVID